MAFTNIVYFDLETTGLDTDRCDIIQLSAVCGEKVFNGFTVPQCHLTESARHVTGFSVSDGVLFRRGKQVNTIPLKELLTSFFAFLRSFRCRLVLAAHNARYFDAPVLTRVLAELSLRQEFQQLVVGFLDTFLLSKNVYRGLASYSQENLVRTVLGKTYNAHDGLEDAKMLQELFIALNPSRRDISRFIYQSSMKF